MARQLERQGEKVGLVAMIGPPAWNPPHWRWIKDSAAAVVRLSGGDPGRATDLFLAVRDRQMRVRRFREYSKAWLTAAASQSVSGRLAVATRLATRLLSGELVSEKPWTDEPLHAIAAEDDLMTAYRRAVASYVRRPYSGRVAVLWPSDVPVNTLGGSPLPWANAPDPSLGWRRVAPDVEVHQLPGDYTTSITRHVQMLADRLKASLAHARSRHDSGASRPGHRTADPGLLYRLFLATRAR